MKDLAITCFGRMNPPTCGHLALIKSMAAAAQDLDGDPLVFLSHSQDPKKNPLGFVDKAIFVQQGIDEAGIEAEVQMESHSKTMFHVMHELWERGYKEVIFVMGEDRIEENIIDQLKKYNGYGDITNTKLYYKFNNISVVNAGHRDDNSDDPVTKASASLLRRLASENNFEEFYTYCIFDNEEDARKLFQATKDAMGV